MSSSGGLARVAPISEECLSSDQEDILKNVGRVNGRLPNIYLTLVRNPALLRQIMGLAKELNVQTLDDFDRELIVLTVASRSGSEYLFCEHLALAKGAGMSDVQIEDLRHEKLEPSLWRRKDIDLVEFVRQVTLENSVSDAMWATVSRRGDPSLMVELVALMGFYCMIAKIANVIKIEVDEKDCSSR